MTKSNKGSKDGKQLPYNIVEHIRRDKLLISLIDSEVRASKAVGTVAKEGRLREGDNSPPLLPEFLEVAHRSAAGRYAEG